MAEIEPKNITHLVGFELPTNKQHHKPGALTDRTRLLPLKFSSFLTQIHLPEPRAMCRNRMNRLHMYGVPGLSYTMMPIATAILLL